MRIVLSLFSGTAIENWVWLFGPLLGAVIGYITNYIAVRMLFWPYREKRIAGRRLPFTPGIIPKRQPDIARAVGAAVGRHLFTGGDLQSLLLDEKTETRLVERIYSWIETAPEGKETRRTMEELALSVVTPEQYEALRADLTSMITERLIGGAEKLDFDSLLEEVTQAYFRENRGTMDRLAYGYLSEERLGRIAAKLRTYIAEHGREKLQPVIRREIDEFLAHPPKRPEGLGDADALRNSIRTIYRMIVGGIGDHFTELLDIAAVVEDKINGMDPKGLEELVLSVMKRELQSIVNLGALLGFLLGFLTLLVR